MKRPIRTRPSEIRTLPAPLRGMVQSSAVTAPVTDAAEYLENWLPTQRGVVPRGGIIRAAVVSGAILSLFTYDTANTQKIFAATSTTVSDVSAFDTATPPTPLLTGRTGGYYSAEQIGTAGGEFLMVVNGADVAQVYDGTSFSAASITGVTTSALSHVWKHANRLFFVEGGTLKAWYLPVDSIGGAATSFSLAGTLQKGGSLVLGGTWSTDSGDGMDDRCVFVSDKGEVAVYEGSDPSNAATWQLVGRYDISPPLGKNATMRAGGDFLIATQQGIIPLSQVVSKDPAALSFDAVSRNIEPTWQEEAAAGQNVQLVKWDDQAVALCVFPGSMRMLTVGLERGAWAIQTGGWTANCAAIFQGAAFVGKADGRVYRLNSSGTDDGVPFTARYCHSFDDLGSPAQYKRAQMARPAFFSTDEFDFRVSVAVDYSVNFDAAPPSSTAVPSVATWNGGNTWGDGSRWSGSAQSAGAAFSAKWRTVGRSGYALAPTLQITSGGDAPLTAELVRIDLSFEVGRAVV